MIQRKVCHAERSRRISWEFHPITTRSFGCAQDDKFLPSSKTVLRNVCETLNTHSKEPVKSLAQRILRNASCATHLAQRILRNASCANYRTKKVSGFFAAFRGLFWHVFFSVRAPDDKHQRAVRRHVHRKSASRQSHIFLPPHIAYGLRALKIDLFPLHAN